VVDFVGFGSTANGFEGTGPTPAPSNTTAVLRAADGCTDNNNNSADFAAGAPNPRNSATNAPNFVVCSGLTPPSGSGSSNPTSACPSVQINLTFTVTPGVPANPIATVVGDGTSISAGTINFTNSSGNTWTATATIDPAVAAGAKVIPITITESAGSGGRTGSGSIGVTVNTCTLGLTTGTGFSPSGVCAGSSITFTAVVRKNQIGTTSTGVQVSLDLAPMGGVNGTLMNDLGDDAANPNLRDFSYVFNTDSGLAVGGYTVGVHVSDAQLNTATGQFLPVVVTCVNSASDVVISQFYGGGGATTGSPSYKVDFVELFNRSGAAVAIDGWTIQYSSAAGPVSGSWSVSSALAGTIQPGQYFLVSMTQAANSIGADLPIAADATPATPLSMGAADGKLAVVTDNVALTAGNPTNSTIKDLLGYGSATGFEGVGAAPGLTNQLANFRRSNGCQDNDQNAADFFTGTPVPRNSATPANNCVPVVGQGTCCAPAGACTFVTQATCASGSVWTSGGTCTPNTCPQPPSGVCCRGSTCTTTFANAADCTSSLVGAPTAGAVYATSSATCNSGAISSGPCCYANYNKVNGITVQDIFDFLNDWFAGKPYARVGGDGAAGSLSVQNIFDFLSNWFAGGCN
jgi:hypothetical protein